MNNNNVSLTITGMTCASCANAVERGVSKVQGVSSANVNFATEKLTLNYDSELVTLDLIKDTVKEVGYGVLEEETEKEVTIPISGMTCASCVAHIEKAISKLEGTKTVSVNLSTEKAHVVYDSGQTRISEIKQAVIDAGYEPLEIESEEVSDDNKDRHEKEMKKLWKKFVTSAIFATPLLFIAMGHMLGLDLPDIINPETNPLNFALI